MALPIHVKSGLEERATAHRSYVFHKTADFTPSLRATGSIFTNLGATAAVSVTLPTNAPGKSGIEYTFVVMAEQTLTLNPGASGAIYIGGAKLSDDTDLASAAIGSFIKLVSDSNGDWLVDQISDRNQWMPAANVVNAETLAGNKTLTEDDAEYQRLDPGGASRDVTLPAEASSKGKRFHILNAADAVENLVVKDDGAATIVTLNQNEAAVVVCDGAAWRHMGVQSIALT